jgi:2-polyprenyl-3-methyl-5-hydroxy-6-metoxy-1,4-benzoquinol methylase
MEYQDYSKWKGWLTEVPFAELSTLQNKKYESQLERLSIPYKEINALEIGYGNGSFIQFLLNNGSRIEGIEIQEPLLDAAKAKGIPVHSSINDVACGPYDLIVAFDVLEHLTIEELKSLFLKCRSLLKEKGAMVFRFPNADSFAGMGAQNGDFTHITAIGQTKLQQIVEPIGLRIERFESEIIYPEKIFVDAIRSCFRYILMKGMGVGNPYFFACNVVALIKIDERSI